MALLSRSLGLRPSIDYGAISSAITDGRFKRPTVQLGFFLFIFTFLDGFFFPVQSFVVPP